MDVKITAAEYEIMNILWEKEQSTSRELGEILKQTVGWQPATTKTLLGRLVKKNALLTQKEGSHYVYRPAISQHKALASSVDDFVSQICARSIGDIGVHLVKNYPMNSLCLSQLKELVRQKIPHDDIQCNCIPENNVKENKKEEL